MEEMVELEEMVVTVEQELQTQEVLVRRVPQEVPVVLRSVGV
jgi:hypothetical protein